MPPLDLPRRPVFCARPASTSATDSSGSGLADAALRDETELADSSHRALPSSLCARRPSPAATRRPLTPNSGLGASQTCLAAAGGRQTRSASVVGRIAFPMLITGHRNWSAPAECGGARPSM